MSADPSGTLTPGQWYLRTRFCVATVVSEGDGSAAVDARARHDPVVLLWSGVPYESGRYASKLAITEPWCLKRSATPARRRRRRDQRDCGPRTAE